MIRCVKCGKEGVTAWQPHRCEPKRFPYLAETLAGQSILQTKARLQAMVGLSASDGPPRSERSAEIQVAPDPPRSNAQSPSPRKPRKAATPDSRRPSGPKSSDPIPPAISSLAQRDRTTRGKPDTAPSDPASLTDAALKPFYNEWMRRKMKAKRAKS